MIVLPGWEEGHCESEVNQTWTKYNKEDVTQCECEKYCRSIPKATGCQYQTQKNCEAFTFPIHVKSGTANFRCKIYDENNNDARKTTKKPSTPGRLTKPYKTKGSNENKKFPDNMEKVQKKGGGVITENQKVHK